MNPRELLGVFIRTAGLAFILFGIFDLYYVVARLLQISTSAQMPISISLQGAVLYSALGAILISCADSIVRLAYWRAKHD